MVNRCELCICIYHKTDGIGVCTLENVRIDLNGMCASRKCISRQTIMIQIR